MSQQRHALFAQLENFLADEARLHLLAVGLDERDGVARAVCCVNRRFS